MDSSRSGPNDRNQRWGFSHFWLATVQLVLQADWQDVWHSPQATPPLGGFTLGVATVRMWDMDQPSS